MTLEWDLTAGALYIRLAPVRPGGVARTREFGDSVMCDEDADGRLLGIEVLSPGSDWPVIEVLARYEVARADTAALLAGYPFPLPQWSAGTAAGPVAGVFS